MLLVLGLFHQTRHKGLFFFHLISHRNAWNEAIKTILSRRHHQVRNLWVEVQLLNRCLSLHLDSPHLPYSMNEQ